LRLQYTNITIYSSLAVTYVQHLSKQKTFHRAFQTSVMSPVQSKMVKVSKVSMSNTSNLQNKFAHLRLLYCLVLSELKCNFFTECLQSSNYLLRSSVKNSYTKGRPRHAIATSDVTRLGLAWRVVSPYSWFDEEAGDCDTYVFFFQRVIHR